MIVSNHGGRQLDTVLSGADALPDIADEVGDELDVIVDGGVRRGTDVIKALALGARAVMIGRPVVYGLAVAGEPGVPPRDRDAAGRDRQRARADRVPPGGGAGPQLRHPGTVGAMKVLVTGVSGGIGAALAPALQRDGHEVRASAAIPHGCGSMSRSSPATSPPERAWRPPWTEPRSPTT